MYVQEAYGVAKGIAIILGAYMVSNPAVPREQLEELRGLNLMDMITPLIDNALPLLGEATTKVRSDKTWFSCIEFEFLL